MIDWRLGCVGQPGNRFRFRLRLRCVRACVRSCVRARRATISPGLRLKNWFLWVARPARPASRPGPAWPPRMNDWEMLNFFPKYDANHKGFLPRLKNWFNSWCRLCGSSFPMVFLHFSHWASGRSWWQVCRRMPPDAAARRRTPPLRAWKSL